MIKVLKDGTKQEYLAICPQCHSEMVYEYGDVGRAEETLQLTRHCISEDYIICPVCGKQFNVYFQPLSKMDADSKKSCCCK